MELKLRILEGRHAGQEMRVVKNKFLVGRAEDCHLRPNSEKISRYHSCITMENGRVTICDMGSKNGTLVNGVRIEDERELKAGDVIEFGPLKFEVRPSTDIKRQKKPVVKSVKEAVARTAQAAHDSSTELNGEADIASWLSDGDEVSEDDTLDLKAIAAETETDAPVDDVIADLPGAQVPDRSKGPGKLPQRPKYDKNQSTDNAAADALRRMAGGK